MSSLIFLKNQDIAKYVDCCSPEVQHQVPGEIQRLPYFWFIYKKSGNRGYYDVVAEKLWKVG